MGKQRRQSLFRQAGQGMAVCYLLASMHLTAFWAPSSPQSFLNVSNAPSSLKSCNLHEERCSGRGSCGTHCCCRSPSAALHYGILGKASQWQADISLKQSVPKKARLQSPGHCPGTRMPTEAQPNSLGPHLGTHPSKTLLASPPSYRWAYIKPIPQPFPNRPRKIPVSL